jgi:hypothetical protein
VRRPQNPTRLTQVYFSLQAFFHSLDVTDLYGEEAEGRLGPWGFGVWGLGFQVSGSWGLGFSRDQIISTRVICFSSKFMNLIYLKHLKIKILIERI